MPRKIINKPYNAGTLTESQYFGKIRSALRNAFRYWKPMQQALKNAERKSEDKTNPRLKFEYQCAKCKKFKSRKLVEIDHIIECGSLKNYNDIVPFIKRLAVEDVKAYQILCKVCHKQKTLKNKKNKNAK